jgi:hypothetical protein
MAAPKLTLTSEQTAALLRANPFGPMTWARQVMSAEDALSFAVHTGLVNIDIRPWILIPPSGFFANPGFPSPFGILLFQWNSLPLSIF